MSKENLLIVFVKNPELGKCKTRLAATVGDEKALTFYRNMLQHTKNIIDKVACDKAIFYSSFIDKNDLWPDKEPYSKKLQAKGDLGQKMSLAFQEAFREGYKNVCIIGSDCYTISHHIIEGAFRALESKDVVIGPSTDGGYYLLGMKEYHPEVFINKEWSTDSVAADTMKDVEAKNLTYELLTALTDIDTIEDLNELPESIREKLLVE